MEILYLRAILKVNVATFTVFYYSSWTGGAALHEVLSDPKYYAAKLCGTFHSLKVHIVVYRGAELKDYC